SFYRCGNPFMVEVIFMLTQQRSNCVSLYLVAAVVVLSYINGGCSRRGSRIVEAPPAYQPSPASPQISMPNVVPANFSEVQDAVRRVFKDAAVIDSSFNPNFLTGDFNGDSSQDLAVILKPVPNKLAEMNEQYPSWLLRDPMLSGNPQRPVLNVEDRDVLLA